MSILKKKKGQKIDFIHFFLSVEVEHHGFFPLSPPAINFDMGSLRSVMRDGRRQLKKKRGTSQNRESLEDVSH